MLLALAATLSQSATADDARGPASTSVRSTSAQDLLFLGRDRILVLRLHLEVDGKPHVDPWQVRLAELFALADRNGDQWLSAEERQAPPRAGSPLVDELRTILTAAGLEQVDLNPPDGRISLSEFTRFAAAHRGGPFQSPPIEVNLSAAGAGTGAVPAANSAPGAVLFQVLDQDRDGRISDAELRQGSASLRARDFDGDGAASVDELDHTRSPFSQRRSDSQTLGAAPIVPITLEAGERDLCRILFRTYGGQSPGGNESLPTALFGIPEAELPAYDEDDNGQLDRREVRTFLARPVPHVELVLRIGAIASEQPRVDVLKGPSDKALTAKTTSLGFALVTLGDLQLEVSVSSQERTLATMRAAFSNQFKANDGDGNGYVDQAEGERSLLFAKSFGLLDRDADGKVFEPEMTEALEGPLLMGLARTRMTANNRGKDLLEILDANRDGRLSQRELLVALSRFDLWDANADKSLSEGEIPQLYQVVLQRGLPDLPGLADSAFTGVKTDRSVASTGPDWFQRMDRNGDGDVAAAEFLGTDSQFRAADRDSNGLIDAEEAMSRIPLQSDQQSTPRR